MSTAHCYLHALGIINALGDDPVAMTRALSSTAPSALTPRLIGPISSPVGMVQRPLDQAFPAGLAHWDCRNNRLLLAAAAALRPPLERALERFGAERIGVVLGTSTSGIASAEAALADAQDGGPLPASFDYRQMEIGNAAPFLAAALGLRGPAFTISTACTSSAKAFASARRLLQLGFCDALIVGGSDALCELTLRGFAALEAISSERANPMSDNRSGINIGEGAALFLMSREDGPVLLAGVGESSDAYHVSAPEPAGRGGELALRAALADAGLDATQIDYVNLHATGTPKNDAMEAQLMQRVFPARVATSGTKPLTGHLLGAAGATELGFAWLTLTQPEAYLPLHLWDGAADPALPVLDLVEEMRRPRSGAALMSNSFAFGGSNASLIIRAC